MTAYEAKDGASIRAARRSARRFIATFLALVLPALAFLVAAAVIEEPARGDLTRVGGYSENDYGWTATHKRFVPPLVSDTYDRPHDIVVLGDSYSAWGADQQTDPGVYWVNHLAQLTGLSVTVLNLHYVTPRDLLEHPVFRATPPRAVILEMVERYVVRNLVHETDRWIGSGFEGCPAPGPSPRVVLGRPLAVEAIPWRRDTGPEFNPARAIDLLWESAWRRLGVVDRTRAYSLPLDNGSFFSSAAADRLLVYDDEFRGDDWTPAQIAAALCRLRAIQMAVEANGRTAFLFVAAPDKLSVYAPHVTDPRFRESGGLAALYADMHLNQVRLLEPMREAVRCGVVDVYLPNDTHWGTPGHEIVARMALEALAAPGTRPGPGSAELSGSEAKPPLPSARRPGCASAS